MMKILFSCICVLSLISCGQNKANKANQLLNSQWMVVNIDLKGDTIPGWKYDVINRPIYRLFKDSTIVSRIDGRIDTAQYRFEMDKMIVWKVGIDTISVDILKHENDSLILKSDNGTTWILIKSKTGFPEGFPEDSLE
jgi:hypothetical protein